MDWLHTEGNKIVDESGRTVRLRGVNIDRFSERISRTFPSATSGDYEEVTAPVLAQDWKVNSVTIPIASGPVIRGILDVPGYEPGTEVADTPGSFYLPTLDRMVDAFAAQGIYTVLAYRFREPNGDQRKFPDDDAILAMSLLALRYRDNLAVLYALQVEPSANPSEIPWNASLGGSKVTAVLKPIFERMIDAIRLPHPKSLIFVPGNQWGRQVHWQLDDPILRSNLVFKSHAYGTLAEIQGPRFRLAELAAKYPTFIGEFAPKDGLTLEELPGLIDWFEATGCVGWHAWQFYSAGPPCLLIGYSLGAGVFTPSEYGLVVKERLLALAQRPLPPSPLPDPFPPPPPTDKFLTEAEVDARIDRKLREWAFPLRSHTHLAETRILDAQT